MLKYDLFLFFHEFFVCSSLELGVYELPCFVKLLYFDLPFGMVLAQSNASVVESCFLRISVALLRQRSVGL